MRRCSRSFALLATLALLAALPGCGQKGALYLPREPAPVPAAAEPAKPAEARDAAEHPAPVEPADPAEEADKHVA